MIRMRKIIVTFATFTILCDASSCVYIYIYTPNTLIQICKLQFKEKQCSDHLLLVIKLAQLCLLA